MHPGSHPKSGNFDSRAPTRSTDIAACCRCLCGRVNGWPRECRVSVARSPWADCPRGRRHFERPQHEVPWRLVRHRQWPRVRETWIGRRGPRNRRTAADRTAWDVSRRDRFLCLGPDEASKMWRHQEREDFRRRGRSPCGCCGGQLLARTALALASIRRDDTRDAQEAGGSRDEAVPPSGQSMRRSSMHVEGTEPPYEPTTGARHCQIASIASSRVMELLPRSTLRAGRSRV